MDIAEACQDLDQDTIDLCRQQAAVEGVSVEAFIKSAIENMVAQSSEVADTDDNTHTVRIGAGIFFVVDRISDEDNKSHDEVIASAVSLLNKQRTTRSVG